VLIYWLARLCVFLDVIIIYTSVTDLDGLGSCQQGGQLLSDCQRLERAATHTDSSPEVDAGESVQTVLMYVLWSLLGRCNLGSYQFSITSTLFEACITFYQFWIIVWNSDTCHEIYISLRGTRIILNTLWYNVDIIDFVQDMPFCLCVNNYFSIM